MIKYAPLFRTASFLHLTNFHSVEVLFTMKVFFPRTQDHLSFVFILNTLIGNETNHVVLLDTFVDHRFVYPVVLSEFGGSMNGDPFWERKPDVYVLNSTSNSLKKNLRKISRSFNYNPNAKFVIVQENIDLNFAEELFRYFISTTDVITRGNSTEYTILEKNSTSYGFRQDFLDVWKRSGFTICFFDESVPPYSLYTVCQNCSKNSGLGFDIADMLLQTLDIKRNERIVPGDDISPESLKNWLTSGMCDMVLSPLIIDDGLLDYIFPVNDDELVWFVPSPIKVPKWKYVTKVFSLRIWIIWMLSVSFSVLFWFTGKRINLNGSNLCHEFTEPGLIKLLIFTIQKLVFTGMSFLEQGRESTPKYFFQMVFLMTIILSTLAINMMYKTGFTSLLLGPDFFEESIKCLEDIVDHRLSVSFAEWRLPAFDGASVEVKDYFRRHNTECETISICVNRMATSKDLALLMSIENIRYDFDKYLDQDGHIIIRPIQPRFLKPLYGSILLKGNPLVDIMTRYNNRLRDHGIIALILSKYNKKFPTLQVVRDKQLTMEHLWGPFLILISGLFISLVTFSLESVFNTEIIA